MSSFAFEDKDRIKKIDAKDAKDKSQRFYCPNPQCDARLHVCNIDGVSKSYFRATFSEYPHINGCFYENSCNFDIDKVDEKSFNFDNAVENLFSPSKSVKSNGDGQNSYDLYSKRINQLKTVKQIYTMCKSLSIDYKFNDIPVWKMLLDNRSVKKYTKGVFHKKIVEADMKYYNNNEKQIFLYMQNFNFMLFFDDEKLFKNIRDTLYENKNRKVIVAGDWKGNDNKFRTKISSTKQICVV